ncbi:6-phosphogluconolactonase [Vagococcus sp. BWB3-3]|uniref:6-phosphogluconolactonase n=1 Tax=Vagococcus allomyrinae TaxID=2794353 RepID=A0A940P6P2_9ENTE|nr:6-phosphogluconolactonase [Vagococcus allomyrinae]MBP1040741.1 6-phosphogluconolactonase [Vagococcus allomyrinae]
MKVIAKKDVEAMSQGLAQMIIPYLTTDQKMNLSLTAGSTPLRAYEIIKELLVASDSRVSETVHFFQQDNLYLSTKPLEYKRFEYINESFFKANQIEDEQITYLTEETYPKIEALIEEAGGLDFAIMGIGADGHIAANMPGTPFENQGYRVLLDDKFKAMLAESDEFKEEIDCYVSIGMKTLMKTKKIIVIASGQGKAEILAKAFNGALTPEIPASILQFHPDVTVLCDEAAARLIK